MKKPWIRGLAVLVMLCLALAGCSDTAPDSSVDASVGDVGTSGSADKEDAPYENVPSRVVIAGQVYTSDQIYPGTEMPALPKAGDITTHFDAATGTLFVNGTGPVTLLYPRTITYPQGEMADLKVVQVDNTVKHIILGEGITGIYNSFNDMKALTGITFPSTLKTIQDSFIDCDSLQTVILPVGLELLRNACFMDCDALSSIKFHSPVIMDHPIAYVTHCPEGCNGDMDTYESWGWTPAPFYGLDALQEVHIYGGSALYSAFTDCKNLKKVTLGTEGGAPVLVTSKADEAYEWPLMPEKAASLFGRPFDGGHKELMVYTTAYCFGTLSASPYPGSYTAYFTMDWLQEAHPDEYPLDSIVRVHFLPQVPKELTTKAFANGIHLDWSDAEGADRYYVYRQIKGEDTWTFLEDTVSTSFVDEDSINGVIYRYAIKAPEYKVHKRLPSEDNPSVIEEGPVRLHLLYEQDRSISACVISADARRG